MSRWLGLVLPEFCDNEAPASGKSRFESPLVFQVGNEFHKLFDYTLSQDMANSGAAPVAETLVKFKALGSTSPETVAAYPVLLKRALLECFADFRDNKTLTGEQLAAIENRIDRLVNAALNFYRFTRETIERIKINEIKNGAFSTESLGMSGAVCPSAGIEHSAGNHF